MSPSRFRRAAVLGLLPTLLFCVGCSEGHRVSGKVTFKGAPVPSGRIYFTPDSSKGGKGPTGSATIKDGQYDTSAEGGKGAPKGPVIVAIEGVEPASGPNKDGEEVGKTLFPRYETAFDVTGTMTKDFEVPAEAAKPKVGGSGTIVP